MSIGDYFSRKEKQSIGAYSRMPIREILFSAMSYGAIGSTVDVGVVAGLMLLVTRCWEILMVVVTFR